MLIIWVEGNWNIKEVIMKSEWRMTLWLGNFKHLLIYVFKFSAVYPVINQSTTGGILYTLNLNNFSILKEVWNVF